MWIKLICSNNPLNSWRRRRAGRKSRLDFKKAPKDTSILDFLFAILSEELGFVGVSVVVVLYAMLFTRAFRIGLLAEKCGNRFAAYVAYGIGMWLSMQAVINMGVNMGLLPTKGLTLPLMSYGGSSLVVCCMAIGLLLRIYHECCAINKQAVAHASKNGSANVEKKYGVTA